MAFTIRDAYPLGTVANTCYFCKAAQRTKDGGRLESVVDPGLNIDFEGFLLVCESCAVEMGQLLGMLTAEQVQEILNLNVELVTALTTTQEQLQDALSAVNSLRRVDDYLAATQAPTSQSAAQ